MFNSKNVHDGSFPHEAFTSDGNGGASTCAAGGEAISRAPLCVSVVILHIEHTQGRVEMKPPPVARCICWDN
jgi:hypothetical protein